MKTIIVSLLFLGLSISYSNAQIVTNIDLDTPYYLLNGPIKLTVNKLEDIKNKDLTYAKIEGPELTFYDKYKQMSQKFTLSFINDNPQGQNLIVLYSIAELPGYTAKISYVKKRDHYSCMIKFFDKDRKIVMKVSSEKLYDSLYFSMVK